MLFDSPGLPLFELAFTSVLWGLETAESEVEPSDRARDKKEIADEVIVQGVVETQHENGHDSLEYFEECAELDEGGRLFDMFVYLVLNLVHKHPDNSEETRTFLTNTVNIT